MYNFISYVKMMTIQALITSCNYGQYSDYIGIDNIFLVVYIYIYVLKIT